MITARASWAHRLRPVTATISPAVVCAAFDKRPLPRETALWQRVEDEARRVFALYNFREIRTPILEQTALFARSVGADTDIVSKEMYTFEDRDQESLTLRPEATASVVRAYNEHSLANEGGIQKLYYIGPMFRRERPQKGRYRQFYQIGAEAIGSESPAVDAEVIEMVVELFRSLGLAEFSLLINSVGCPNCRPVFVERLRQELKEVAPRMCADCRRRAETNPLRVLDCKVPEDQPVIDRLPSILDSLCEVCRPHFEAVKSYLADRNIEFEVQPRLVRGLDYYMRTTFEVVHGALGAQNSVLGGGRYDGLMAQLGGQELSGVSEVFQAKIEACFGEIADRIAECLEEARRNGDIAPHADPQEMANLVLSCWEGAALRSRLQRNPTILPPPSR